MVIDSSLGHLGRIHKTVFLLNVHMAQLSQSVCPCRPIHPNELLLSKAGAYPKRGGTWPFVNNNDFFKHYPSNYFSSSFSLPLSVNGSG